MENRRTAQQEAYRRGSLKACMGAAAVDYWLARKLKEMVDDLLSESQIQKRGLFRPEAVRAFVDEHHSGAQNWSMQIWQFLTLEHWMHIFLDGGGKHAADLIHRQQAATA